MYFGGVEVSAALSGRTPTATKKRIPNLKGQTEPVSPKWTPELGALIC
jgi:hypothetical protein